MCDTSNDELATAALQQAALDVHATMAGQPADKVHSALLERLDIVLPGVDFRDSEALHRVANDISAGTFLA